MMDVETEDFFVISSYGDGRLGSTHVRAGVYTSDCEC